MEGVMSRRRNMASHGVCCATRSRSGASACGKPQSIRSQTPFYGGNSHPAAGSRPASKRGCLPHSFPTDFLRVSDFLPWPRGSFAPHGSGAYM